MQQQRSRVVWFVAIFVAFFFFVDPFNLFTGSKIPQTRVASSRMTEMIEYLDGAPGPGDLVVKMLTNADVVLVGETGYAQQQVQTLVDMIPVLDRAGIHYLGYEYANRSDQEKIDRLLTSPTFDEELAKQILFNHLVVFGYQEHVEVFRSAWTVNRTKSAGDESFRILGISTVPNYGPITSSEDLENAEIMRQVFADAIPDSFMANSIIELIIEPRHKAAVYVQISYAMTKLEQTQYEENMAEMGFAGEQRTGNILENRYGNRVATVVMHGPVQDSRSQIGFGYLAGGIVDQAVRSMNNGPRPVGFVVEGSPFSDVPVLAIGAADKSAQATLLEMADGYIAPAPIREFVPLTAIPGFITDVNLAVAREKFPGADPGEVSAEDLNTYIAENGSSMTRVFEEFGK